ncbi:MAG: TonB-dependent receptor plug domain-containing protein [Bacteroidales bacterium]|nr:TonB-dependent receptor plug domain-containing protein [Bacteroidales bacterium]
MKCKAIFAVCLTMAAAAVSASAQTASAEPADSTIHETLYGIYVESSRAPRNAPFAISNVSARQLTEFSQGAQELPFLLSRTPGVLSWSDNGVGTGTSYLRIRGAGDSRINITLDGVPLNSPEDQCVFWANMNSYSSFLGGIEIQRGIGSSTNGDGAFGGTVALTTKEPSKVAGGQFDVAYGSYNTYKVGVSASSGLLADRWMLDLGYHHTGTDGFMAGTAGNSGSWMVGLTCLAGKNLLFHYYNIGNYEKTGQAWNGVDTGDLLDGTYGAHTGIYGYKDLWKAGLGTYNSLSQYWEQDADGKYVFTNYKNPFNGKDWRTTDNFVQDHNILSMSYKAGEYWNLNASLHYTYGSGYYDEFRYNNKLSKFGLASFTDKDGNKVKKSDFIRKKGVDQNAYGVVLNAQRKTDRLDLRFGVSAQNFNGWHYGYLSYIGNEELLSRLKSQSPAKFDNKEGDYMYYDSDATKTDFSVYAKASYEVAPGLSLFGDLQYRMVRYVTDGINDKFLENEDGTYTNQELKINQLYNFFNPKAGLDYTYGCNKAYFSVAWGHREPERNNFTDNGNYPAPKPESLLDYELGYSWNGQIVRLGVNGYFMDYRNQFVKTGAVSDIGEALTTNIAKSYRVGVELTADVRAASWLDIYADAALSRNRIKDFNEVVEDWDAASGYRTIHYSSSTLAFSPSAIIGGGFNAHYKGFKADWRTSYVSRQYIDNTECLKRSLPGYTTTDVNLSYTYVPSVKCIKDMTFGLRLGNIFNSHHACSAWVYSAIAESYGHPDWNRYTEIGYFPAAGITAMGTFTIRF